MDVSLSTLAPRDLIHLLQFVPGLGPASFQRLYQQPNWVELNPGHLSCLSQAVADALTTLKHQKQALDLQAWQQALAQCDSQGVQVITLADKTYPPLH